MMLFGLPVNLDSNVLIYELNYNILIYLDMMQIKKSLRENDIQQRHPMYKGICKWLFQGRKKETFKRKDRK